MPPSRVLSVVRLAWSVTCGQNHGSTVHTHSTHTVEPGVGPEWTRFVFNGFSFQIAVEPLIYVSRNLRVFFCFVLFFL